MSSFPARQSAERGVALVITLLMLSAITFLAVAFLAMSRRDRAAVTSTMDLDSARNMSDAALNRAQAEIVAQMEARGDALSYDYMVSRNYINPFGFTNKNTNIVNVNYDYYGPNSNTFNMSQNPAAWAQNIANLYYDPRPPVFVVTNPAYPNNSDFRFWVDINRNGRFETNGYLPYIAENGLQAPANYGFPEGFAQYNYMNGEPEWIGVLRDPLNRHSATNIFVGRYAYMVLPIGKTLDFNYIHNFAKGNYINGLYLTNTSFLGRGIDGFARDQGIASYELNLAALLDVVSPDAYQYGFPNDPYYVVKNPEEYQYYSPYQGNGANNRANVGFAFDDAEAIVHYRYWNWQNAAGSPYIGFAPMQILFRSLYPPFTTQLADFDNAGIDSYLLTAPTEPPFDPTNKIQKNYINSLKAPWPGGYSTNMFYDPQDLFDPVKTSIAFTNRILKAGYHTNTEDRYTFERLLQNIGTGSEPEYGVWVYNDAGQPTFRTKMNINFDNTAQIQRGPYTPMPTNLVNWTPLGFFTNAAELLLRSQGFTYTNYALLPNGTYLASNLVTGYFGVTNIPVFRFNNPGIQYNQAVHRMLQLAANIYTTTVSTNFNTPFAAGGLPVRHPFVFRPLFARVNIGTLNDGINIVGFTNDVTDANRAYLQMAQIYYQLNYSNVISGVINDFAKRGSLGFNVEGIPWVVSAEKGTPQFYEYADNNRILFTRKVLFSRYGLGGQADTNRPPQFTNQFYVFAVSNSFGMGAWNPYSAPYAGSTVGGGTTYYISNNITISLTNNHGFNYSTNFYYLYDPVLHVPSNAGQKIQWPKSGNISPSSTAGFVTLVTNNLVGIPPCYYSEYRHQLVFFTNGLISSNSFLPQDTNQTSWPVYNWTLNVTNHVVYALFDGSPSTPGSGSALLDYVNIGPFGSSISITNLIMQQSPGGVPGGGNPFATGPWAIGRATSLPGSPMSAGLLYQVAQEQLTDAIYNNSLIGNGAGQHLEGWTFGSIYSPSNVLAQSEDWVANDPLVHYTIGDLYWPLFSDTVQSLALQNLILPMTNNAGRLSKRYNPWPTPGTLYSADMLLKDPGITAADAWQFPSNKFPSVGWLGRVHRGTPWQTVYFKSDNASYDSQPTSSWVGWTSSPWNQLANMEPDTYPTNDWALADLFTAALDVNSARGLLSVNQTNDGAWAAALAGVIALTNVNGGVPIAPTDVYQFVDDPTNGINAFRSTNANGLFHKVGEVLAAPALTAKSPFLTNLTTATVSDQVVERIPQQIMGLLKVGEPQFVIYAWGESLRPKNLYLSSPNNNLCTNYEITGEFLTRTVCHVVHTNGPPRMVVDSYNVEPAN